MAKLTIELDTKTHQELKRLARGEERSLTQYIQRALRKHAGTLVVPTTTSDTTSTTTSATIPDVIPKKRRSDIIAPPPVKENNWYSEPVVEDEEVDMDTWN